MSKYKKHIMIFTMVLSIVLLFVRCCNVQDGNNKKGEKIYLIKNFTSDNMSFISNYNMIVIDTLWTINQVDKLTDGSVYCSRYYKENATIIESDMAYKLEAIYQTVITYWKSLLMNDSTKYHVFNSIKNNNKFFFLGKLNISSNIDSYLILRESGRSCESMSQQDIFLLNVKNNKLFSFLLVFTKSNGIDDNITFEGFRHNNIFVYFRDIERKNIKKRFFGNKNIEETKKKLKNTDCILYKINDDGYIEIIERK
ncbi:hypothetical protein FACS189429_3660 [Bacteroidia bacterium]|nr:hypothetical protein FACS189429_3660 [Bacteroidia bacterium]